MKYIAFIVLFLVCTPVFAGYQWIKGNVDILEDYGAQANSAYQVVITLKNQEWYSSGSGDGPTNCTGIFRLVTGQEGVTETIKDRIFSLMLSGYLAGRKVRLYVNTSTGPECYVRIGSIGDSL